MALLEGIPQQSRKSDQATGEVMDRTVSPSAAIHTTMSRRKEGANMQPPSEKSDSPISSSPVDREPARSTQLMTEFRTDIYASESPITVAEYVES